MIDIIKSDRFFVLLFMRCLFHVNTTENMRNDDKRKKVRQEETDKT